MSTVLLVRHGLTAMTGPVLAGHTPGLHLDDRGRKQAEAVAARIAALRTKSIDELISASHDPSRRLRKTLGLWSLVIQRLVHTG